MLRAASHLMHYTMHARDGEIGRVRDFLFDDERWTVRYMVATTGRWLLGRSVLIAPESLGQPSWKERTIPVALTQKQIEQSPRLDEDKPVSRQFQLSLQEH